jgi:tRNA G18 (ribose-2'-O)-methylase SpoU
MRGYFGIGVEGLSKAMNLGALMRTANAFGASFVFTVDAAPALKDAHRSDTSKTSGALPYYQWDTIDQMVMPEGARLVGIELTDDAIELPSFTHPKSAVYVLGRERGGNLSDAMQARCDFMVKIPTKFCINVGLAGALVMYDRMLHVGQFAARPVTPGIGRRLKPKA